MKAYRFMSAREFHAMSIGMDMIPENLTHKGKKTTSEGFCFLPETVIMHGYGNDIHGNPVPYEEEIPAEQCICFLSGIVSRDVLVEFEAPEGYFRVSEGVYADPDSDLWDEQYIWINELCCDEYNRDLLIPTRYAMVASRERVTWYPYF